LEFDNNTTGQASRDEPDVTVTDAEEAGLPGEEAEKAEQPGAKMELYDWLQCIVTSVLALILIFVFVARIITVDGTSMLPTLYHTDRVVVSNLFYSPGDGDIVIIKTEAYGEIPLVKRVIASGGETIDIDFESHEVSVDGRVLDEPYISEPTARQLNFEGPVTVPAGYLFVMGDNRNGSTDSRSNAVGFVDVRDVIGKVWFIIVPGPNSFGLRQWSRIGPVY
jgi:signal peptidase I